MDVNKMYEAALQLAIDHHKGIRDKSGKPYIMHPLHVASKVTDMEEKCAALLHDTKEDEDINGNRMTDDMLKLYFMSPRVIMLVDGMTRRDGEHWKDYIMRIKHHADGGVRRIKIQDLLHNMDLCRMSVATKRDGSRCVRYHEALKLLGGIPE